MTTKQFGWAGPLASAATWAPLEERCDFIVKRSAGFRDTSGERMVLWEAAQKVYGDFLPNIPQEIGDCVSWGLKHAIDHLACFEIARLGQNETFRPSFAPYFYGISRVQIGGGQLGRQDGSLGIWGAEGVKQYGVLAADEEQVPAYSGEVARQWGNSGPPQSLIELGRQHLVRDFARIRSYAELRDAIANGYPVTIASLRGFAMQLTFDSKANKHWWTGRDTWPHQMWIVGVDDDPRRPGAYRGNNWGPHAHGPQADGPPGGGWQDAEDLDRELRDPSIECIAYSQFDGFVPQSPNYYWY